MIFLRKVWLGEYSLSFTFWIMGCVAPAPIFAAKYFLNAAGALAHENMAVFIFAQAFLWLEWAYFAFITVALWNASVKHLQRANDSGSEKAVWGQLGRLLAVASGLLAIGSFANLSGLTTLIFGQPLYLGMGAG
ncbi:MAG: hypothetical protein OEU86_09360 [Gammaproteobacteria bacterium]|nr:hypothetical protein [Gammaproteobacteria bacterium]